MCGSVSKMRSHVTKRKEEEEEDLMLGRNPREKHLTGFWEYRALLRAPAPLTSALLMALFLISCVTSVSTPPPPFLPLFSHWFERIWFLPALKSLGSRSTC